MMASVNSDRLREVLRDTLSLLCRNSLSFHQHLSIQGLLAVTIDASRVIVLQVNESVEKNSDGTVNVVNVCGPQACTSCKCGCPCTQQNSTVKASKPRRKRPSKSSLTDASTPLADQDTGTHSDWGVSSADEVDVKRERLVSKSESVETSNPSLFVTGLIPGMPVPPSALNQLSQASSASYPSGPPLASFTTLAQDIKLGAVGEHWNSNLSASQIPTVTCSQPMTSTPLHSQALTTPPTDSLNQSNLTPLTCEAVSPDNHETSLLKHQMSPRTVRAERARLYRLSLKHNPALRDKYEETKRKNRERMRRHRQLVQQLTNHSGSFNTGDLIENGKLMEAQLPASMSSPTPSHPSHATLTVSPSTSDSERLWQDIHNWQTQPIMLTVQPPAHPHPPLSDDDNIATRPQPQDKEPPDFK